MPVAPPTDTAPSSPRPVSDAMARGEPRLPRDWPALDANARAQRLLHMASSDTYHHFVQAMVRESVDLNPVRSVLLSNGTTDPLQGSTPLLVALHGKAWRNARTLLDAGANLRATDASGRHVWTHLLGHPPGEMGVDETAITSLVHALLAAGADPNQRQGRQHARQDGQRDNTALHLVYQGRRYHLVAPLLDAGAEAQALAPMGSEPLMHGRSLLHDLMSFHDREHPASAVAELHRLLGLGLDPNAAYGTPSSPSTPRRSSLRTPLGVALALDEVAMELLRCGGTLGPDGEGHRQAWLTEVAFRTLTEGRGRLLPALHALGMEHPERLRNHDGHTPLFHLLDQKGLRDPLPQVLDYQATFPDLDLLIQDNNGHSLAHTAAFQAHPRVLQWLLDSGVPMTGRDHQGETPLDELRKGPGLLYQPEEAFAACARLLFGAGLTPHGRDGSSGGTSSFTGRAQVGQDALCSLYARWEGEQLRAAPLDDQAPLPTLGRARL